MIIGLTGRAGAGKDTVADYLVENYGFKKLSFASTLKEMLAVAGFPEPANRDDKEKKVEGFDFTWREAAQKLGTEWARGLDKDFWLKVLGNKIKIGVDYVISDVRFDNEAEFLDYNYEGWIINIVGRQVDLGDNASHPSEKGVKDSAIHYVLNNDGTIQDMKTNVDDIIYQIRNWEHSKELLK